jgi:opacity protein-like surface antigen
VKKTLLAVALAAAAATAAACHSASDPSTQPAAVTTTTGPLQTAYAACGSKGVLTSQHNSLTMDTSTGAVGKADIFCVLTNLTAPANIAIEISQTAEGKIGNDAWDKYLISWVIEGDGGWNVTIIENS